MISRRVISLWCRRNGSANKEATDEGESIKHTTIYSKESNNQTTDCASRRIRLKQETEGGTLGKWPATDATTIFGRHFLGELVISLGFFHHPGVISRHYRDFLVLSSAEKKSKRERFWLNFHVCRGRLGGKLPDLTRLTLVDAASCPAPGCQQITKHKIYCPPGRRRLTVKHCPEPEVGRGLFFFFR